MKITTVFYTSYFFVSHMDFHVTFLFHIHKSLIG